MAANLLSPAILGEESKGFPDYIYRKITHHPGGTPGQGTHKLWLDELQSLYVTTKDPHILHAILTQIQKLKPPRKRLSQFCWESEDVPSSIYVALYKEGLIDQYELDLDHPGRRILTED